jgi:predicted Zn-dependent protease
VTAAERQPGQWRLEPSVEVLLSPGQRAEALRATAVHELGHGFGLWGHSPNAADALAATPGPVPVLHPSPGDRATLEWLQRQPTPFGQPLVLPPPP